MEHKYVKNMRIAGKLMCDGFKLISVQKDINNPNFDLYVFRNTPKLTAALDKYIECGIGGNRGTNIKNSKSKIASKLY